MSLTQTRQKLLDSYERIADSILKINPEDLAQPELHPRIRINIELDGYERDGCDKTFHIKDVESLWYMVDYLQSIRDHGGKVMLSD